VEVSGRITGDADVIETIDGDASGFEAVSNRLQGKAGAVLDSIEPFFFNGRHNPSVFNYRCCSITVIRVDAKYVDRHAS
jgi:hypothetical protein